MSFWNPLTWGEKSAENVLDKDNGLAVQFGGFIDDLSYTDAEKAANNLRKVDFALARLKLLEPFKIVQRVIAACTLFGWLFVLVNLVAMLWLDHKNTDKMMELAFSDYVFWPVICVFTLYCGGGVARYFRRDKDKQ